MRGRRARWPAAALVVALLGAAPAAAQAQGPSAFTPRPCFTPLPAGVVDGQAVRCGYVRVPLDYADPGGRTIRIAVAVVAARTPTPAPDPVLMLGGGPGDKFLFSALGFTEPDGPFAYITATRDLVLLDQRGAGFSRPALECDRVRATDAAATGRGSATANRRLLARFAACARDLRRAGNELGAYKTPASARDLDRVRRALGYAQVNVFGTSYGSLLALEAARRSPRWIRSLVLASPAPTQNNLPEEAPLSYASAVRAVSAQCAAEPACAAVTPDFAGALDRVVRRLAERPQRVSVSVPGRAPVAVLLDGPRVAGAVFSLLYLPEAIQALPTLVGAADRGDLAPLATVLAAPLTVDVPDLQSEGMKAAFWCSEQIAPTSPRELRRAARVDFAPGRALQSAPLLGLLLGPAGFAVCDEWDVGRSAPSLFRPVRTAIPTFIATGRFDPITPTAFGAQLARTLSRSFVVEFAGAGHAPLFSECGFVLLTQFIQNPLAIPDTACAAAPLALTPPTPAQATRTLRRLARSATAPG